MHDMAPLAPNSSAEARRAQYAAIGLRIEALLEGETDWVAAMATVACELHHGLAYSQWTGFYRHCEPEMLVIGPYQGGHGCLRIPFGRGVCGAAARTRLTQLVVNVHEFPGHIACSATTKSELVVPVLDSRSNLVAVLDLDSDTPGAFTEADVEALEELCGWLGRRFG